ncbi:MAG: NUDIX domain-containing protein [Micrococcales bacterium]|nr:NUDIX domain-containing protein [Micrococcales bacterium]
MSGDAPSLPTPAPSPGDGGRDGVAAAYAHLHDDAVTLLEGWAAPDEAQERLREGFLAHLRAHPDAMAKAGPPAHLTSGCIVFDESMERVLLTLHAKAREWFQFGGHFETGDQSVRTAATREAREESGIATLEAAPRIAQLDRHSLGGSFGRCREHLDIRYAAVAPADARHLVSSESLDVAWWPVTALPEGSREELTALVRAGQLALRAG